MNNQLTLNDIMDYLVEICRPLVDYPDEIEINDTRDERGILFTITLADVDYGKIIGRQGATINAIRTIVRNLGIRHQFIISIKLNEPDKRLGGTNGDASGGGNNGRPFSPRAWNKSQASAEEVEILEPLRM